MTQSNQRLMVKKSMEFDISLSSKLKLLKGMQRTGKTEANIEKTTELKQKSMGLNQTEATSAITEANIDKKMKLQRAPRVVFAIPEKAPKIVTNETEANVDTKQVYLYVQLQEIKNVPARGPRKSIGVKHPENCVEDIQALSEEKYTFAIPIEQDNFDKINLFSDKPLLITLYETYFSYSHSTSEINTHHRPIAQGYIDLLPFFTKKRSISNVQTFLYPIDKSEINIETGTCQTIWHIYSLMPLLLKTVFSNIVFITFESIYNADPEVQEKANDLVVEVSFLSKVTDEYNAHKFCQFRGFTEDLIAYQDPNLRWASLLYVEESNMKNLGQQSNCKLSTNKIFNDLLCTENVNFDFENINPSQEFALVCNSMHRYILSQNSVDILHELIAFNEQELLLEIYCKDEPDQILYHGVVDLSIFMYPRVNSCRFAVALTPETINRQSIDSTSQSISSPGQRLSSVKGQRQAFAIINICLLVPLSEANEPLTIFNKDLNNEKIFKMCNTISRHLPEIKDTAKGNNKYIDFEEQIRTLTDVIIKNNITDAEKGKTILCCHITNLENQILKLIAGDFNVRFPTETSTEFMNLMTTVYKELMFHCNMIVDKYIKNSTHNKLNDDKKQQRIISFMTTIKLLREVGDEELANMLSEKLKELYPKENSMEFFEYLYDIEKHNFDAAKKYMAKPMVNKYKPGEKFTGLIEIYIKYVEKLNHETVYNEALQYLLSSLGVYTRRHPQIRPCWLLMHCLYKLHNYLPGMSYTRWKYDNVSENQSENIIEMPISRWHIYLKYTIETNAPKLLQYITAIEWFTSIGLYKFAEIIFETDSEQFNELQQYIWRTTFKLVQNELPEDYQIQYFPSDIYINSTETMIVQAQVNGNVDFLNGYKDAAMQNYNVIVNAKDFHKFDLYLLSIWRYGYYMFQTKKFEKACRAFSLCDSETSNSLVGNLFLGKAMYCLNKFKEAETYFSNCTNFNIYMPDVWAFLALVNLKMGRSIEALESWKYAKLEPDNIISNEILEELNKINTDELKLVNRNKKKCR